ncbi:putative extracellular nuclease [Arcicella aurantiaca]|uniref:Putative extracellular nuclease n=1 Tax=Arcicella aurantiaca TaxID=591202 RepID=A0A316DU23_9BACT|nr:endonuclease/exonuclease/phosphatase family protein [Arcicella aurantiaca]PWK21455.1 putative extracellular nuclease [Arcicella aurantiaca]
MKHFVNQNFRSVLLSVFSLLLFQTGFSQVNPTPLILTSNSHSIFTSWANTSTNGTFPSNMAFWVAGGRQEVTPPTVVGDWNCVYNLTSNSRFVGKGSDGISMVNTGTGALTTCSNPTSSATVYPYAIVLALNTTNRVSLDIVWTGGTVSTGQRPYILQLQYRIGSTGSFIDISGASYSGSTTGHSQVLTSTLPSACENQSLVQLRWIYIQSATGSGTRPELRIDEISVNSIPASPTLTVNPTSLTNFTYVESNGPSTAKSYTLSGSILSPDAGNITATAPTNFEISTTSGTTGFADSQTIPYTGGAFTGTTIYTRLKAGLAVGTYSGGNITHSGGNVASPPSVALSGSVTSVPPPVVTTTGTLTAFSTFVGNQATSQSYTVSGTNLVSDITITAPSGFEIKTGLGTYASSLVLPQSSGSVASTTIDVRLINTTAGTFSGNITHATTNLTPSPTVAVSGTVVAACATPTNISVVRASIPEQASYTGVSPNSPATVAGRVTAIFGTNKFYVQDATGGLAIFSTANGGVVAANGIALGDSVKVTGPTARFNGEAEFNGVTCVNKVTGSGVTTTPPAIVFDANNPPSGVNLPTFLTNNEGRLVKIISNNINVTGTFGSGTNYSITACNSQGEAEIRVDATATTIPSQPIPTVTQDITGVIGHYINASATVNILQLFPRTISDFSNSAITCVTPVPSPSASCGAIASTNVPVDSTLDVTAWNVEWLGNTTTSPSALGPTNDAQQMTNVISVLNTLKSDVFCVEEVCDHKQFIARVGTDLPDYGVVCQTKYYSHFFDSPETNSATSFGQKVCFLYKKSIVSYVDTLSLLASQYGYNATPVATPYPNNWASGRLPYMFVADITLNGLTKRINFVGLHAKSGSDAASYNRRKQDVIDLKAELDTNYPNANIIMLGDYNDDLDGSIYVGQTSTYANFVSDNTNYVQISKSLSDCAVSSTASYADIIDHIMVSNEFGVIPVTGPNPAPSTSGIYYLEKTVNVSRPINYVAGYTSTTSDHYPVNARFRFGLPPVAPATITSIGTGNWSSPSTWDCNCVPTSASDVIVDTAHTVTVDIASQAKTLNLKGTLNWVATFTLSLGM